MYNNITICTNLHFYFNNRDSFLRRRKGLNDHESDLKVEI